MRATPRLDVDVRVRHRGDLVKSQPRTFVMAVLFGGAVVFQQPVNPAS